MVASVPVYSPFIFVRLAGPATVIAEQGDLRLAFLLQSQMPCGVPPELGMDIRFNGYLLG